jgi:hypothetical protein
VVQANAQNPPAGPPQALLQLNRRRVPSGYVTWYVSRNS